MPRKVLVVDDEPDILDSLKEMLQRRGCQVFACLKTEEAWEVFQKERPDAVSIDIHMYASTFDGLELLKKIREIDKDVYCIVFTVEEDQAAIRKAEALGVNEYREKPGNIEELKDLINTLAGLKKIR
jgi:two-component system response regulator DctR